MTFTTPEQAEAIRKELAEDNPDALLYDNFEEAIIGIARRCGQPALAVYDRERCIEILKRHMSEEEAVDFFEYNTMGAWVGPHTPIVLVKVEDP